VKGNISGVGRSAHKPTLAKTATGIGFAPHATPNLPENELNWPFESGLCLNFISGAITICAQLTFR